MTRITFPILVMLLLFSCNTKKANSKYISNEGLVYGTIYHITYESPDGTDLKSGIERELSRLDSSVSTFNKTSVLSKVNRNEDVLLDDYFKRVFNKAMEVSEISGGAFDVTVAPLVNAWGFGFKSKENVTPFLIDSILDFVGYNKVRVENDLIVKDDPRIMLDFSAIAKGYAVDVAGEYLKKMGCKNYMVEIGGEVVAKGVNKEGKVWRIGINKPKDNEPITPSELEAIISLPDKAIATSGNYRNFYIENGKKYAHTINPHSGYPVDHNLLSASVIADDCMTADAYATACMVLGVEKTIEMSSKVPGIEIMLIFSDEERNNQIKFSKGFEQYIEK